VNMPKPTPGHARLEYFVGTWEGEETMHPSEWAPEGSVAHGRTQGHLALSGFAVLSDYEQSRDGVTTFTGHGVYTYDPQSDEIVMHWFDCMGSPPEVFRGRFDGDIVVLAHGGPGMHARMTYDFSAKGRLSSKMEMSKDGNAWRTLFEATYRRSAVGVS